MEVACALIPRQQIYPILQFRDKIVKAIHKTISKIPGLEKLIEHVSETLTAFVLGLLAPFIRPIIEQVSKALKDGSSGVIGANAKSQLEPWRDAHCDNPTHSMLSKDHFTNILNSCAGRVAATILQYVVPRVIYAFENPGVPVEEVVNDVLHAFHHPAIRDESNPIQRDMFETVRRWSHETPLRGQLNDLLASDSVKNGKNHRLKGGAGGARSGGGHDHGHGGCTADGGHGKVAGSLWSHIRTRDLNAMDGADDKPLAGHNQAPYPPQPAYYGGQGPPAPPPPQGEYGQPQYKTPYGQQPPPSDSWSQYPPR